MKWRVPIPVQRSKCRTCGASIVWTETATGKKMPLSWRTAEAVFDAKKNITHWAMASHFSDCRDAGKHRKKAHTGEAQSDEHRATNAEAAGSSPAAREGETDPMPLQEFNTAALPGFDQGRLATALDQALGRVMADCADRPGVKRARTVTLAISVESVPDERGNLDRCKLSFDVKDSLPKRESRVYDMAAQRGYLMFQEDSPEDARQRTLEDELAAAREKKKAGVS